MEVPGSALFLELSATIKFEIEQRQLFFLKHILDKDPDDPVHDVYNEQLNCITLRKIGQIIFLNCDVLIIFHSMMKTSRE